MVPEDSPKPRRDSPAAELARPHNLDAERAVLGSLLLDNEVIPEVSRVLRPEDFYQSAHQAIYGAVLELHDQGKPVDLTLLTDSLRRTGKLEETGGYMYLAGLENHVLATSAAVEHAEMVAEKSTLRRLMAAAETILRECSGERREVLQQVEMAERLVFEVSQKTHAGRFLSVEALMQQAIDEIARLYVAHEPTVGLQTHIKDLDSLLGGFEKTALIILAARPSIGKTAFALNIVRNVSLQGGVPVGFFSLEMSAEQLNLRLLASEARLPGQRIRRGQIKEPEWERVRETASRLMDLPLYIDDTAGLTLMQLRSRARRLKKQRPDLGLLVVDYLQLMQSPPGRRDSNRQQEVAEISRGLKELAKELEVPILALSQLSRGIEQRGKRDGGSRPMLSDLRESGAIEQDADVVMFVHRERVEVQKDEEGRPVNRTQPIETEIIVGKNRNGPIGTAQLLFIPDFTLFVDMLKD